MTGGITLNALNTNYVSDGDIGFTNSGVFTIGGQNTSGTNTYANPIILGWTANKGKSVTLVAATGGEVDFTGGIGKNGTDATAGITVGDATHGGTVKIRGTGNSYGGVTTVSNGTLWVSGTLGSNAVTVAGGRLLVSGTVPGVVNVQNGGTLGGNGSVGSWVTNQAGGTVFPGLGNSVAGAVLTDTGTAKFVLLSGSTNVFRVSADGHTSDQIVSAGFAYGGTLTVLTNAGDGPLTNGSSYTLFNSTLGVYAGTFAVTNLPALNAGLAWTNTLGLNGALGVISVATVNTNPYPVLTNGVVNGNQLALNWGSYYLGWRLQVQTNNLATGLGNNWVTVPNSTNLTGITNPVDPAQPAVFFRLIYP